MGRLNIIQRTKRFGTMETFRQLGYLTKFFLLKHILRQRWMTRKIHNYKLRLDLQYPGLSRAIIVSGTREDQLKLLIEKELKPGSTVLDLGANIGYYTMMMGNIIGKSGKIYAIEPEPRNFDLLKFNIALNGMEKLVEAQNIAAGVDDGKGKFFVSEYSNFHTMIPFNNDGGITKGVTEENYIEVQTVNPSKFLIGKRSVDLIRMDIEGFEVEVLNGLEQAIKEGLFSGKIVFEAHFPKYNENHSMKRALEMLFKYGYKVTAVTSSDEKTTKLPERGYRPLSIIQTSNNRNRGIYGGLKNEDAIYFICEIGGIRDVVLSKAEKSNVSGRVESSEKSVRPQKVVQ